MKTRHILATLLLVDVLSLGGIFCVSTASFKQANAETYSQGDVVEKNKARIWIGYDPNNPFYSYADETTGIRLWIHSTSSGGSEHVYGSITGTFNNVVQSNRRYDYFDVDISDYTNSWYMTVQKFQGDVWKAQTNSIQLSASNAGQVYFVWGDWVWDQTAGTVDAGIIDSVDAGLAAKALGGIHTCSNSSYNGYNLFANYNSTFVKNGDNWKTSGNISDYTLNDFASGDTSYSGTKSNTVNAYDKYLAVQALYNSNGTSLSKANPITIATAQDRAMIIVVTVAVASVTVIGGYFFLKRRKEN